ncbi:hypothetical protein [Streptomyces sp. NPDC051554]|uniref:hypothetical protein n=1 Tax=Streptomyces sp. NPDC051554 TaxID=3365656 RepID=UPI0037AF7BE5
MRSRLARALITVSLSVIWIGLSGATVAQAYPVPPQSITNQQCWESGGRQIVSKSAPPYCEGGTYNGTYVR